VSPSGDPVALGLPHRDPFIFIDEVLELIPGESARGRKVFPASEPFFRGHFPGQPIVPGVLLTEALAQTAGIAASQPGTAFRLSAIRGMKFLSAVGPEQEVLLSARKVGMAGPLWQFEVSAQVEGRAVAEGVVVLSAA
jgi:3-hydroxyacyl-[acyl-carrier-protein] dehydratase